MQICQSLSWPGGWCAGVEFVRETSWVFIAEWLTATAGDSPSGYIAFFRLTRFFTVGEAARRP